MEKAETHLWRVKTYQIQVFYTFYVEAIVDDEFFYHVLNPLP